MRRERGQFKRSPRSRWLKGPLQQLAKAELAFMLPGFRFLFAAIVLSISILVFGRGAAALLRAAHEEFASTPSWHPAPEAVFAQRPEAKGPVLAMLRVEPVAGEWKATDNAAAEPATNVAAPVEQAPSLAAPAAPERMAAL